MAIRTIQTQFSTQHCDNNQGYSETQRYTAMLPRFPERALGFTRFLDIYTRILGLMYFGILAFDFQHRSTQPTPVQKLVLGEGELYITKPCVFHTSDIYSQRASKSFGVSSAIALIFGICYMISCSFLILKMGFKCSRIPAFLLLKIIAYLTRVCQEECYTSIAPLGLRILYHQNLLKSVQSVPSATIRDSDENINMPPL